jgi:hypothetical protein
VTHVIRLLIDTELRRRAPAAASSEHDATLVEIKAEFDRIKRTALDFEARFAAEIELASRTLKNAADLDRSDLASVKPVEAEAQRHEALALLLNSARALHKEMAQLGPKLAPSAVPHLEPTAGERALHEFVAQLPLNDQVDFARLVRRLYSADWTPEKLLGPIDFVRLRADLVEDDLVAVSAFLKSLKVFSSDLLDLVSH